VAEPRPPLAERLRRALRWGEALGIALGLGLFRLLPLDTAGGLAAFLCRRIGPLLPVSRFARRNLRKVFPEKSEAERARILLGMWDNLGRIFAEYAHLDAIEIYGRDSRVEVVNAEEIDRLRDDGRPGIFFSAHLGNWELAGRAAVQRGLPITLVYRAPNNPLVDALLRRARGAVSIGLLPKGSEGGKRALAVLQEGGHIGILVDQKMNDGIAVPFFGRPAMTAPALARLALRFDCPVVPAKVERLRGSRFRLTVYPPLAIAKSGDRQADTLAIMTRVNAVIEGWIRERPEQWLWLHRRWPE
jgi:KDO2-lipid IV(A) lauroyltransferase